MMGARYQLGPVGALLLIGLLTTTVSCMSGHAQGPALSFIFLPFVGGNSPSMDLMGVAAALQTRGHKVTVVVTDSGLDFAKRAAARHSSNTTAESMHFVRLRMADPTFVSSGVGNIVKLGQQPGKYSSFMMLVGVQDMLAQPCSALLKDTDAMQQLRDVHANAIMGLALPMANSDSCGCVLSGLLGGVPFIDINGHPMVDAPITVPQFGSGLAAADLKTLSGIAMNTLAYVARHIMPTLAMDYGLNPWTELRRAAALPRAVSGCPLTNLLARLRGQRLQRCRPLLEVLLSTFLIEPPRSLAAHQKLVGPGTPRQPHPILPVQVAEFVGGASEGGLVLVAFGSTTQTVVLTRKDMTELARGFATLAPTRVLWAITEEGLPEGMRLAGLPLGANTMTTPWVDYNDVLGHPHTEAFVSHCGVHSVNEAAFHGVPVVGVPIQFEQAEHAARLVARGVGLVSPQAPSFRKGPHSPAHFTAEGIQGLVQQVLSNATYRQTAQAIASAMRHYAAQRHPYQRAADEVELAVLTRPVTAAGAGSLPSGRSGHCSAGNEGEQGQAEHGEL